MINRPRPIVILGPTAGGKSQLAVAAAQALDGQIIGADSMQVYRHMNAGTAKPSDALRRKVLHHLIDVVDPTDRFTVADWLERADALIEQLRSRQQRPIVVGGTNLYIKALLEGFFTGPPANPQLRDELGTLSGDQLLERLERVDPDAADRIHRNDHKKLVRALEVFHETGQRISQLQSQWTLDPHRRYRHEPILIGLDWPVALINQRINQRVKTMFYPHLESQESTCQAPDSLYEDDPPNESLLDETQRLAASGMLGPQASQALGYKQVLEHLEGRRTLEEAFENTKILTRRFAKNQRTWLRRFSAVRWIPMADRGMAELADEFLNIVTSCKQ